MKPKVWLAVGLALLCLASLAGAQEQQSLFEQALPAVVKIRVSWQAAGKGVGDEGTGFIIDSTKTQLALLTNRHVVAYADSNVGWRLAPHIWVIPYGTLDTIRVAKNKVCFDRREGDDLAVLYIDRNSISNFRVLPVSKRQQFDGTPVHALGYSAGKLELQITRGIIVSSQNPYYNIAFDITARAVQGGESGSPVLNDRGIVAGVITEKLVTGQSHTNRVLQSLQVRQFLKDHCHLDPPTPENQILALSPLDFEPAKKQPKWSKQFLEHLESFIALCPEIRTKRYAAFSAQWQPRPGDPPDIDALYKLPSYIVRGSGSKEGKLFVLDLSLRLNPGERVVLSKRLQARDLKSLADSAVVHIARHFGYQARFEGVPYAWRKWSLRTTVAGILPAVLMWQAAGNGKSDYEQALTSRAADNNYSRLHRNEMLRNSAALVAVASLGFWTNAAFINPRKPVFEKEVK
ncbi:serine protease [candidate division KSB1 bacterium]|nr:serine protease [candidate division KSB1 bacterium]